MADSIRAEECYESHWVQKLAIYADMNGPVGWALGRQPGETSLGSTQTTSPQWQNWEAASCGFSVLTAPNRDAIQRS